MHRSGSSIQDRSLLILFAVLVACLLGTCLGATNCYTHITEVVGQSVFIHQPESTHTALLTSDRRTIFAATLVNDTTVALISTYTNTPARFFFEHFELNGRRIDAVEILPAQANWTAATVAITAQTFAVLTGDGMLQLFDRGTGLQAPTAQGSAELRFDGLVGVCQGQQLLALHNGSVLVLDQTDGHALGTLIGLPALVRIGLLRRDEVFKGASSGSPLLQLELGQPSSMALVLDPCAGDPAAVLMAMPISAQTVHTDAEPAAELASCTTQYVDAVRGELAAVTSTMLGACSALDASASALVADGMVVPRREPLLDTSSLMWNNGNLGPLVHIQAAAEPGKLLVVDNAYRVVTLDITSSLQAVTSELLLPLEQPVARLLAFGLGGAVWSNGSTAFAQMRDDSGSSTHTYSMPAAVGVQESAIASALYSSAVGPVFIASSQLVIGSQTVALPEWCADFDECGQVVLGEDGSGKLVVVQPDSNGGVHTSFLEDRAAGVWSKRCSLKVSNKQADAVDASYLRTVSATEYGLVVRWNAQLLAEVRAQNCSLGPTTIQLVYSDATAVGLAAVPGSECLFNAAPQRQRGGSGLSSLGLALKIIGGVTLGCSLCGLCGVLAAYNMKRAATKRHESTAQSWKKSRTPAFLTGGTAQALVSVFCCWCGPLRNSILAWQQAETYSSLNKAPDTDALYTGTDPYTQNTSSGAPSPINAASLLPPDQHVSLTSDT